MMNSIPITNPEYPNLKRQLSQGMKILFIGINPHPGSYRRGVPFSNSKMLWYLLSAAGILPVERAVLRDDESLKKIYDTITSVYHIGFMNIIDRPTKTVNELNKNEEHEGKNLILTTIQAYRPEVVCFVGKITYKLFSGVTDFDYGWQPAIQSSKIYTMHTPLRGPSLVRIEELKEIGRATKILPSFK